MQEEEKIIRNYLVQEVLFLPDESSLTLDEQLLEKGIIDSASLQVLISFLEEEFNILVTDELLVPESFQDIRSIAGLVRRLKLDKVSK